MQRFKVKRKLQLCVIMHSLQKFLVWGVLANDCEDNSESYCPVNLSILDGFPQLSFDTGNFVMQYDHYFSDNDNRERVSKDYFHWDVPQGF